MTPLNPNGITLQTLYSKGAGPKKTGSSRKTGTEHWTRRSWESASTIERKVDVIKQEKIKRKESMDDYEIEKKVDKILSGKKATIKDKKEKVSLEVPNGYQSKVHKKTGLRYFKKKSQQLLVGVHRSRVKYRTQQTLVYKN